MKGLELPEADLSSLSGRSICLDPGHGGPWPGAVSKSNGLRESDVNLRVGVLLKQILERAGAKVLVTRTDDSALVPESLSRDLAARTDLANSQKADCFVSIHHNASIQKGSANNYLAVFYNQIDDGPSLELAQSMTTELARRLKVGAKHRLWSSARLPCLGGDLKNELPERLTLPGSYKVLRESAVPAVLLESSFMTNKGNAKFLASEQAVEAEALAIAAGLAAFFEKDPPVVGSMELRELADGANHQLLLNIARGFPIEANSARLWLNGIEQSGECAFRDKTILWTFSKALSNGTYDLRIDARNAKGASLRYTNKLDVDRLPARIEVVQRPKGIHPDSNIELRFDVFVYDLLGLPVKDGHEVHLSEHNLTARTRNGKAHLHIMSNQLDKTLAFKASGIVTEFPVDTGSASYKTLRVLDEVSGEAVAGAVIEAKEMIIGTSSNEGWAFLSSDFDMVGISRTGYDRREARLDGSHSIIRMAPSHQGVLHGITIALDAANGGREAGSSGLLGTRSSDVAMDLTLRLMADLRRAGASVVLTRDGDDEPTSLQRVATINAAKSDICVSIGCGGGEMRLLDNEGLATTQKNDLFVAHYPNSANGILLARSIADKLETGRIMPSVSYIVQQTSCPAVLVQVLDLAAPGGESEATDVEQRKKLSKAIFEAILDYYAKKVD